jgi:hypothetical protein
MAGVPPIYPENAGGTPAVPGKACPPGPVRGPGGGTV